MPGYEQTLRDMTITELLQYFHCENESAIAELNKENNSKGFPVSAVRVDQNLDAIQTFTQDKIAMCLIEIVRRMGASVNEIKEILKKYPLLQYKDGQEEYFLIEAIVRDTK